MCGILTISDTHCIYFMKGFQIRIVAELHPRLRDHLNQITQNKIKKNSKLKMNFTLVIVYINCMSYFQYY